MAEWKESKLGEHVDSISETYKFKPNEQVVFLNTSDILLGRVINRELQDSVGLPGQAKKKIKKGDFLFSEIRPANGRYAMIDFNAEDYVVSTKLMVLRCNDKIDRNFFRIFLTSKEQVEYLQMIAEDRSGTFPQITFDHIYNLNISLPPLTEQKAIASVLSSLDDKIDLLHRQNKILEAMAETLFRQWFVEEAQEDWKDGKIPDEFDYVMGASPPGESYNEAGVGIPMFQGNADFEFRFPKRRIFTKDPKRFAEKYDTLISVRAPVGAQNMADEECCIGRGVSAFRYKRNNDYYTYTYFKMKSLMKEIEQYNDTGTVFGSISKGDFELFDVVLPPHELVDKFQKEVKPIDDKVIANVNQIRTLEKLRDTLLPKLMSGEVRVTYAKN
jgi:type I restriction enzyme S subunit